MAKKQTDRSKAGNVKAAITEMEDLMGELAQFGASDTEPDGVWQSLLMKTIRGREYKFPVTVDDWQLYDIPGAARAASRLAMKAKRVIRLLQSLTVKEAAPVLTYLEEHCWRCC